MKDIYLFDEKKIFLSFFLIFNKFGKEKKNICLFSFKYSLCCSETILNARRSSYVDASRPIRILLISIFFQMNHGIYIY